MIDKRFTEEYNERDGIYLFDNLMREKFYINPVGLVDRCNSLWERTQRIEKHYQSIMKENEKLETKNQRIYQIVKDYVCSHPSISTMSMLKNIEKELKK